MPNGHGGKRPESGYPRTRGAALKTADFQIRLTTLEINTLNALGRNQWLREQLRLAAEQLALETQ